MPNQILLTSCRHQKLAEKFRIYLHDENISEDVWASILRMNLSNEQLKIIESVPDEQLNDFDDYVEIIRQRICQYFILNELRQRERFRNLQPKTSQIFLDFSAEVQVL